MDDIEQRQDRLCIDFWNGSISRADARSGLIATGLEADVVDEGLSETEQRKAAGLPMVPTLAELEGQHA